MPIDDLTWDYDQPHKAFLLEIQSDAKRRCLAIKWDRIVVILLLVLLPCVLAVDYAFLLGVFDYLLADESGTGEVAFEAYVLAGAGVIAVLAWHAITYKTRSERFERSMGIVARVMLPLFLVGSGLLLAAVLYANGLESFAQPSLQDQVQIMLGETAEASERPFVVEFWEQEVQPVFPVLFSLGLGGLFLLSAFLGHVMTLEIGKRAPAFLEDANEAKSIQSDIDEITAIETQALAIRAQIIDGGGQIDERRLDDAVGSVLADVENDLAEIDRVITIRKLNPNPSALDIVQLRSKAGVSPDVWSWDVSQLEDRVTANRQALEYDRVRAFFAA